MNGLAKTSAASVGLIATLALMAHAQGSTRRVSRPATPDDGTIAVSGTLEWLEVAQLSALQEGNVKWLEPNVGSRVHAGEEIGQLHDDIARINAEKAELVAKSQAGVLKAKAQFEQAKAKLARDLRAIQISRGSVSEEELDKDKADLNYADALQQEAQEKRAVDAKEAELAAKILQQHTITSPIDGFVLDRMKNPGESVRANEPLLRIGKTDRFKFVGWVPLEVSQGIRVGDVVQFRPIIDEADLAVEKRVFDGKVMAVNKEGTIVGNTEISVLAEINNPPVEGQPELELIQGMRGEIRITRSAPRNPATATRTIDAAATPTAAAR